MSSVGVRDSKHRVLKLLSDRSAHTNTIEDKLKQTPEINLFSSNPFCYSY